MLRITKSLSSKVKPSYLNSLRYRYLSGTAGISNQQYESVLNELGLTRDGINSGVWDGSNWLASGDIYDCVNPSTQEVIAKVQFGTIEDYERCANAVHGAKRLWASTPAPKRGEVVRQIGLELRTKQLAFGKLLSMEMGKILPEGIGEVQEFIDMCDLAAGMSRQIPGQVLPSEREVRLFIT